MLLLYTLLLASVGVTLAIRTPRLLIYSYTDGFRHDSIPTAVEALKVATPDLVFDATEEMSWFNDTKLSEYDALLFLDTSGEFLNQAGKDALQRYLNKGGNFIGVHCASAGLLKTDFYRKELGARFDHHPKLSNWTVEVLDTTHPSTQHLPVPWLVQDEEYYFLDDPRDVGAIVILSVNDTPAQTNNTLQGSPHPIAWYQEKGAGVQKNVSGSIAGRSFYTALGHRNESWHDPVFMQHVIGGIVWTLQSNVTKAFNETGVVGSDLAEVAQWPSPPPPPAQEDPTEGALTQKKASSSQRLTSAGTAVMMLTVLVPLALFL